MPKKKVTNDKVSITLAYKGMTVDFFSGQRVYHYVEVESGKQLAFKKKLWMKHGVGSLYKAYRVGESSYGLDTENYMSVGKWKNSHDIAEWVKDNELAIRRAKAKSESAGLRKQARLAVAKLAPMYKRASEQDKLDILRAIVETLEE